MEGKKIFKPGDIVTTFTGQVGMVISKEALLRVRSLFKEGNRPGHYFAPGCCHNPDYVIQIPVFFEDETFDIVRSMNIKKRSDMPDEKVSEIIKMIKC